ETLAGAVGDDLTVGADDVPVEGGRVAARIAERAVEGDDVAFVDGLVGARVRRGGHVVDRHDDVVAAAAAVIIGHGVGHRVGALVVRGECEALAGAVGDDLAVAGHDVPLVGPGIGARIGKCAGQRHRVAFVNGLVGAGVDRGRNIRDVDGR